MCANRVEGGRKGTQSVLCRMAPRVARAGGAGGPTGSSTGLTGSGTGIDRLFDQGQTTVFPVFDHLNSQHVPFFSPIMTNSSVGSHASSSTISSCRGAAQHCPSCQLLNCGQINSSKRGLPVRARTAEMDGSGYIRSRYFCRLKLQLAGSRPRQPCQPPVARV